MMKFVFTALLSIGSLLFSFSLLAEENWQHDALRQVIKDIKAEQSEEPMGILATLDGYIEYTKKKGWKDIETLAMSQKAKIYLFLQELDKAKAIADQYLPITKQLDDFTSKIILLSVLLEFYDSTTDLQETIKFRLQYEAEALASSDPHTIATMYLQIASSKQQYGDIKGSLLNAQKALQIFEKMNDQIGIGNALNSIAILYGEMKDHKQALEFYKKALKTFKLDNVSFSLSVLYYNIGQSYFTLKNITAAQENLLIALNMSRELKDEVGEAFAYRYLGKIAAEQKDYDAAYDYFVKALDIFSRFKINRLHFITTLYLADVQSQMGDVDKALKTLMPLEATANELNRPKHVLDYYNTIYQLEKKRKHYLQSLQALEKANQVKKSIHEKEKNDSLQELMLKFHTQQKEAENQLLQHQNELKALQLIEKDSQRTIYVLVIVFSVFCLLIILFLLKKQINHRNNFKQMALLDDLTGSPNRRAILAIAQRRYTQCKEESSNLTIAMLDIDHFKKFNDTYGHDVGDSVLRIFSEACRSSLRSHDRYGRFGGEEWLLVLPDAQENEVAIIFNRLRKSLKEMQLQNGLSTSITFSLGSAQLSEPDNNINDLIKRADENLYKAKEQGRDRYVVSE